VLLASVWAEEAIESQLNTGINKPKGLGPKINDSDPFDFVSGLFTPFMCVFKLAGIIYTSRSV
jgi:hypothetical protein